MRNIFYGLVLSFAFPLWAQLEPRLYPPTSSALAPERRIRDIFPDSRQEAVVGLRHVRALKIDVPLARQDIPPMRAWSVEKIHRWFEKVGGVISLAQAQQEQVNTKIETDGTIRIAYRPRGYGRVVIVEYEIEGFEGALEVKNSGVAPGVTPSHAPHGNGLGTLGEATREDEYENALRASIQYAKQRGELSDKVGGTVAGYGVLDAGFSVKHADGTTSRAGLYLRQAHRRLNYDEDVRAAWLPGELKAEILGHISRFGFYTGWESNIQGLTKDGKVYLFDFGHWIAWQGLVNESGIWVDPKIALNFALWGWNPDQGPRRDQDQWRTSKLDRPWNWAHDTADSTSGDLRNNFINHYNDMLGPFLENLDVGLANCSSLLFTR